MALIGWQISDDFPNVRRHSIAHLHAQVIHFADLAVISLVVESVRAEQANHFFPCFADLLA
jgi:hypothetical protein